MNYEHSDKYWDDYNDFLSLIKEEVKSYYSGNSRLIQVYKSPNSIIEGWKETVESGKGYQFTIFEWDNDICVRGLIENILINERIRELEFFYQNFKERVMKIDEELNNISIHDFDRPNCKFWWEKKVLKYGGQEYRENVKTFYAIDLDINK